MIYSDLRLIVDGGSENNNHIVDRYVEMLPNLQKLVALKDIQFGNVQVEAHNKILKQSWLYRTEVKNGEHLKRITKAAIHEFNMVRPYDALGGLTPSEAHEQSEDYMNRKRQLQMLEARKQRCITNKCNTCTNCPYKQDI